MKALTMTFFTSCLVVNTVFGEETLLGCEEAIYIRSGARHGTNG